MKPKEYLTESNEWIPLRRSQLETLYLERLHRLPDSYDEKCAEIYLKCLNRTRGATAQMIRNWYPNLSAVKPPLAATVANFLDEEMDPYFYEGIADEMEELTGVRARVTSSRGVLEVHPITFFMEN